MSYKLDVLPAFWQSEFVPAECIYSGRVDDLVPVTIELGCYSDGHAAAVIHGRPVGMIVAAMEDNGVTIEVPAAPGEHARATAYPWHVLFWTLPILAIGFGGGYVLGKYLGWWLVAWILWVLTIPAAGTAFTLVHFQWDRRRTQLDLLKPGGPIQISFPNHLKSTFGRYRDAYKQFMRARGAERRSQGRKGGR